MIIIREKTPNSSFNFNQRNDFMLYLLLSNENLNSFYASLILHL